MAPMEDELKRLEDNLRSELAADRSEARDSRHSIRKDLQDVFIELARMESEKWLIRALFAIVSAETAFIVSNIHKIFS